MERRCSHGGCESGHWEGRLLGSFGGQGGGRGYAVGAAPTASPSRPVGRLPQQSFGRDGERVFKKEPMDAPGYADLAARRRELLKNRLEARKDIGEDRLQEEEGLESPEELLQRVRAVEEQLVRTSAALKAIRCHLRQRRQSFYEEELQLAWKRRDLAAIFRWSRLLGGRRWGSKKSDHRALSAALPSRNAWKDEWTKPGAEGGMGASVLENWLDWRSQTRDLLKRSEIKAEVVGEARMDMEQLVSSFRTVKKRRACLAGSPPAEKEVRALATRGRKLSRCSPCR